MLFIIFNSFILSIIITKAAVFASLYPGLPKQLYKIMMDLCNRLMMTHFYRIVFLHDFDKKNFHYVIFLRAFEIFWCIWKIGKRSYKKFVTLTTKTLKVKRRQPKPPPDFLFIFTIIIYAVYFA